MKVKLGKAIEIVQEHHPYAWAWEFKDLALWVKWFNHQHLLLCITVDGKAIIGLLMFRTVMKPEDGIDNSLNYDPEGSVVFIDFVYAPTEEIRRGLAILAIKRIGRRDTIAWQRHGTLRSYSASRFVLHTLKEKTHA